MEAEVEASTVLSLEVEKKDGLYEPGESGWVNHRDSWSELEGAFGWLDQQLRTLHGCDIPVASNSEEQDLSPGT